MSPRRPPAPRSHRPVIALALLALAGSALAGCLAPGTAVGGAAVAPEAPADWAARALPFGNGHSHRNVAHHAGLSTPNFEVVGWDPLVTDYHGKTSGGYFCGGAGTREDGRRIAIVHSWTTDVAFVVADVTDAAHPVKVGEFVLKYAQNYDSAMTPDARYVAVALSTFGVDLADKAAAEAALAGDAPFATWRDACTLEETPLFIPRSALPSSPTDPVLPSGVALVDLAVPERPVLADYRPLPLLGAHSVSASRVDGVSRVLASVTNLQHPASYFELFQIVETPAGAALATEWAYRPAPAANEVLAFNGHVDGTIAKHPVTGHLLAYLADWNGGFVILDLSLPVPRQIAKWNDYATNVDGGLVHGTYPLAELWDGKHYTIVGQEVGGHPRGYPTGVISVFDTTDPAKVQRVGAWTLPVDVTYSESAQFSTHYVAVVGKTMFVTMYHGGMWAVDLTDVTEPRSVGVFIPDRVSPLPPGSLARGEDDAPLVLDVEPFPNGDMAVWDTTSGIYVVRFDESNPAPRVPEWPIRVE